MYLVKCLIRCLRGCRFTKVFLFIIEHPPDSKVKVYTAPPKLENAADVPVVNRQDSPALGSQKSCQIDSQSLSGRIA